MNILHAIDDAVIDRVFQPMVNRLQVRDVAHVATPCYAFYVATQIARALVLHAQGLLGGRAMEIASSIGVAGFIYVGGVLNSRDALPRPNPIRRNPICRFGRLLALSLTLGGLIAAPFNWPPDADTLLSCGGCAFWAAGRYFDGGEVPPPRPKRRTVPDAVPNTV